MTIDTTQQAREIVAAHYDAKGWTTRAALFRKGEIRCADDVDLVVKAISPMKAQHLALNDAIAFAIQIGDIDFLQAWEEGDFTSIRDEYPEFDMTSTIASGACS